MDFLDYRFGSGSIGVGQNDSELFAAEAGDQVGGAPGSCFQDNGDMIASTFIGKWLVFAATVHLHGFCCPEIGQVQRL
ncbi:MAG: hypothetical protein WAW36_19660 [Methylovulum miyakonense]|uniref:hypothetical protein n=1 Tax=Methylovulum miyakonense TaxID=645578 RepID=UPI003BB5D69B